MTDKKLNNTFRGPLAEEIVKYIDFKHQSGSQSTSSEMALKAFDRFCVAMENQNMSPLQLAEAWVKRCDDKPKHDHGYSVRQLGQYLTETHHPKAFTVLDAKGNAPKPFGVHTGPFAEEIKEFIEYKRMTGRKYIIAEYCLKAFNIFCAIKDDSLLSPQQIVDEWHSNACKENSTDLSAVRELGLYLTMQGSKKAFFILYANGNMPKPQFSGYTSMFAEKIESFIATKRAGGLSYEHEIRCLRDFDRFCSEQPHLTSQQLAEEFIHARQELGNYLGKRSISTIREFGKYLTHNGYSNAFSTNNEYFITGPYAVEISAFVVYKRSCGFKYINAEYHLKRFDAFCASSENEHLSPQQLADKWILKKEDEHPNTRSGRVGPVRVFGKYLTDIGHSRAFSIADDIAPGAPPKPPYLFFEDDIDIFFAACAGLKPDGKDPYIHIVLPSAFLFMHCMGVRTCELIILMENVNFDTGEVIIVDAKNGDRVVHMSKELTGFLSKYNLMIEKIFPSREYLFPASVSRSRNDFAQYFRAIWMSSVPNEGHGTPRLYDFRHHFLYRNVELCMRSGGDVNVLRPYIMRHMGHKLPESFQYYFHLSPPIQKEISRIKNALDWMIPDIPEVPYE